MLISLLLILSSSFAPLTPVASPVGLQNYVQCLHKPNEPPASVMDCTNLLRLMSQIPAFHERKTYISSDTIQLGFGSCVFNMRGRVPPAGQREGIRLVEYFPAVQEISDQCLETPEGYNGGVIYVGALFLVSLGADGLLGNRIVLREGGYNSSSAGTA